MNKYTRTTILATAMVACGACPAMAVPELIDITVSAGQYIVGITSDGYDLDLAECPAGYYCAGEISATGISGNKIVTNEGNVTAPYGLTQCPDGTTSDAGAKSESDCYAPGDKLYTANIDGACNVDMLGVESGTAKNSFAATFVANQYTVSLHSNYGTDTILETVTATYDSAMPTPTVTPVRTGYNFTGYFDATTGGNKYYTSALASSATYKLTTGTDLYAQWNAKTYTITYNCGAMTGTPDAATATYDAALDFATDAVCTHIGYTFDGWKCSNGVIYTSGESVTAWDTDSDLQCNATWSANTINIKWTSDGAQHDVNQCRYGGDITIPTTTPTKTGYTFKGWKLVQKFACETLDESICDSTPGCRRHGNGDSGCYYDAQNNCASVTDENECNNAMTDCNACTWSNGACGDERVGIGWPC